MHTTNPHRPSKQQNARNTRYKRPALALVQRDHIDIELNDIYSKCADMERLIDIDDDDSLIDALEGDSEELHEFRFAFSDLQAKCDSLSGALNDSYVTEHFDDFLVGALGRNYQMVGYDSFEEDYFGLTRFEKERAETESNKRLMRLTKQELVAISGQCMGIFWAFLDIRHQYDNLKSTFDLLKEDRAEMMAVVQSVLDAYEKLAASNDDKADYDGRAGEAHEQSRFDSAVSWLPDWVWVQ